MHYNLRIPLKQKDIDKLEIYDTVNLSGKIYAGRDAALPRLVACMREGRLDELGIDLTGSVVFHTAVSCAGVGPTSSNKLEIEESLEPLSAGGVKLHLGKGSLEDSSVAALARFQSVFAVTPPVTALFFANMIAQRLTAFPELGMEALYELEVVDFPAIIAVAHGRAIFTEGAATC